MRQRFINSVIFKYNHIYGLSLFHLPTWFVYETVFLFRPSGFSHVAPSPHCSPSLSLWLSFYLFICFVYILQFLLCCIFAPVCCGKTLLWRNESLLGWIQYILYVLWLKNIVVFQWETSVVITYVIFFFTSAEEIVWLVRFVCFCVLAGSLKSYGRICMTQIWVSCIVTGDSIFGRDSDLHPVMFFKDFSQFEDCALRVLLFWQVNGCFAFFQMFSIIRSLNDLSLFTETYFRQRVTRWIHLEYSIYAFKLVFKATCKYCIVLQFCAFPPYASNQSFTQYNFLH